MAIARLAAAAASLLLAVGAVAQTTPAAPTAADPQAEAGADVTPQTSAPVAEANAEARRLAADRNALTSAVNNARQAQYDADMAEYRRQIVERQEAIARDQMRYDRQQRAYADAMRAWRSQVYDCKHGKTKACRAPAPRTADFL